MYHLLSNFSASEPVAYVAHERKIFGSQNQGDVWSYPYYDRHWERRLTYVSGRDYLECDKNYQCQVKPELSQLLTNKGISLLSVCESNGCLSINDSNFLELVPGLYYFSGKTLR